MIFHKTDIMINRELSIWTLKKTLHKNVTFFLVFWLNDKSHKKDHHNF